MNRQGTVYVLDDDPTICESVEAIVHSLGHRCEAFTDLQQFPSADSLKRPGCLVLDHVLGGNDDGLQLIRRLHQTPNMITTIVLTAFADVPLAVQYMQAGAVTLIEKPITGNVFADAIVSGVELDQRRNDDFQALVGTLERYRKLTDRQKAVLEQVLTGLPNKRIAANMMISVRTIEAERSRILSMLRVENAVALAGLITELKLLSRFHGITEGLESLGVPGQALSSASQFGFAQPVSARSIGS